MLYKLSPSDFRYLWEDCKHCFYQKVKYGITLPSIGLPGVFSKMNGMLQDTIQGMNLKEVSGNLPDGIIRIKEGFLKSTAIPPANSCYISGRFDILSELKDGSFAVIDFKITDPSEAKAQKFAMQLHAYKYALENPAGGVMKKITKMGLVVISPESVGFEGEKVNFRATPVWYEIAENMNAFYDFIGQVAKVLNGPPPKPSENCAWCKYRICFDKPQEEPDIQELPF